MCCEEGANDDLVKNERHYFITCVLLPSNIEGGIRRSSFTDTLSDVYARFG